MSKSFKELNKKMEEFEKKIKSEGEALFKEICNELFEKYPEVNSFSWTQYTPYWNDGEECYFSVNEVDQINGYNEYDDEGEGEGEGENIFENFDWEKNKSREYKIVNELREFISAAPSDVLRSLFGDHTRVTVYRDAETETQECEHE